MSNDVTLKILENWGDTLEREILNHADHHSEEWNDLLQVLYPYAGIWHDHILPRRDMYDMTRLDDKYKEWIRFASSHYTALIRTYQVYRKFRRLKDCCMQAEQGNLTANLLIDAHDALSGFWEHLGSVIDNLGRCFDDAPVLSYPRGDGLKKIQANQKALSFAFARRTQMIHYSLVPIGFEDGMIVFNEHQFIGQETDWSVHNLKLEDLATCHVVGWKEAISDLSSVWNRLRDEIRRADKSPPQAPGYVLDLETGIKDGYSPGSGVLTVVQSRLAGKTHDAHSFGPYWDRVTRQPSGISRDR